jgi:excisionase family DNA binding protein
MTETTQNPTMANSRLPESEEFCTTREAARLLGLSLGKVQKMAEEGELRAWKTSGGHRRVSILSVEALLRERGQVLQRESSREGESIDVLIAEDNLDLQRLYQKSISSWALPIFISTVSNGIDGLLNIGLRPPDVLIVDLLMPGVDGFEMIQRLRMNAELDDMDIVVVTGMDNAEIEKRGGLPGTVTVYQKPIPFSDLRGYFHAKLAQHRRSLSAKLKR